MMTVRRKPSKPEIYQIKITLLDIEPDIWRRVLVPGDLTLGELHDVIQISMGWNDAHLHQFRRGQTIYSDPQFELDEFEDDTEVCDEQKIKLDQVLKKPKDAMIYEYDFGDDWRHLIELEKLLEKTEEIPDEPVCIDGCRNCPPEDCGGIHGYIEMLDVLEDSTNPQAEDFKEWLPDGFSAEYFNPRLVNYFLYKVFGV